MRLLKRLNDIDYKMVGLKVLENCIERRSVNFSFESSSDDMTFLKNKGENTEVSEKIDAEKKLMPEIISYNSAFAFSSRVRDRLHDMKDQMKKSLLRLCHQ